MALTFLLDEVCLKHESGPSGYPHPENSERIKRIINAFNSKDFSLSFSNHDITTSKLIENIFSKVHDQNYINKVVESKNSKQTYFDQDTIASKDTYNAAYKAASLAISAGLSASKSESYFSVMRPPGHHATFNRAMGFCYFNNIALATQALINKNNKVVIVDFDFHYGNGTADIFWTNPNALYISIHADPTVNYPNQGFIDEIGDQDGKGYNVCIPLTYGSTNKEILFSFYEIIFPLMDEFKPNIIAISAGFDAFKNDPIGGGYLQYDANGYNNIGQKLFLYSREKKIPIFHILEGGYNLTHLPNLVYQYSAPWIKNGSFDEKKSSFKTEDNIKSKERKTIKYIKQILNPYWNI